MILSGVFVSAAMADEPAATIRGSAASFVNTLRRLMWDPLIAVDCAFAVRSPLANRPVSQGLSICPKRPAGKPGQFVASNRAFAKGSLGVVTCRSEPASPAIGSAGPKADLGLLVTLTARRADRVQPRFCATSARAVLKNLGDFVPWQNSFMD